MVSNEPVNNRKIMEEYGIMEYIELTVTIDAGGGVMEQLLTILILTKTWALFWTTNLSSTCIPQRLLQKLID